MIAGVVVLVGRQMVVYVLVGIRVVVVVVVVEVVVEEVVVVVGSKL